MPPAAPAPSQYSILWFVNTLLRSRRLLVGMPAALVLLAVAVTLTRARKFEAESSFVPQSSTNPALRYAGLAAQFGINVGSLGAAGEGADFYVELLESTGILREAVLTKFRYVEDGDTVSADLRRVYDVGGRTPEDSITNAIDELRDDMRVRTSLKSSFVQLAVVAPTPELAVAINRRLLDLIVGFNQGKRQTQAGAERTFISERLEVAESELRRAEGQLQRFLEQNRAYQSAPHLAFEAGRLQRAVENAQQVYSSLTQAYEQARIEEVRNTPLVTVVTQPEASVRAAPRGLVRNAVLAAMLGAAIAILIILTRAYLGRQRNENPTDFAELESLARAVPLNPFLRRRSKPTTTFRP